MRDTAPDRLWRWRLHDPKLLAAVSDHGPAHAEVRSRRQWFTNVQAGRRKLYVTPRL